MTREPSVFVCIVLFALVATSTSVNTYLWAIGRDLVPFV